MTHHAMNITIAYVIEADAPVQIDTGDSMSARLQAFCDEHEGARLQVYDLRSDPEEKLRTWLNEVLQQQKDGWFHFLRSSASYDPAWIPSLLQKAEEAGEAAICLCPQQKTGGKERSVLFFSQRDCRVDISGGSPQLFNPVLDSFFLRRDAIGAIRFEPSLEWDWDFFFLLQVLEGKGRYYIDGRSCLLDRFLITDGDSYRPAFAKEWYEKNVRECLLAALREHEVSRLWQGGILYLVHRKLYANRNNAHKETLTETEVDRFEEALAELLQYVEDPVLTQQDQLDQLDKASTTKSDPRPGYSAYGRVLALYLLRCKYGGASCEPVIGEDGKVLTCLAGAPVVIDDISHVSFQIDAMNYEDGQLKIDGELKHVPWANPEFLQAGARCGPECFEGRLTGIYRFERLFGRTIWRACMVQVCFPENVLDGQEIRFYGTYKGRPIPCGSIGFSRIQAHLHRKYKNSYWVFGRHIISGKKGDRSALCVTAYSTVEKLRREGRLLREIGPGPVRDLRIRYHLSRMRSRRRRVWITYDQLFKGGDNGEYFYRYVREHHPSEVDMYYLMNEKMAKEDPAWSGSRDVLLADGKGKETLRMQLAALQADMIFSTRAAVDSYFGFQDPQLRAGVCDLFNAKIVCIQHGLTVQKIAQYQNRLHDNLKYYFCASPFEKELICRPVFGYDEEMAAVTGVPRYDGLGNQKKEKQILITPTWRRNVTDGPAPKGSRHPYNPAFRDSRYFRIYQELIGDERLLSCAKETGYRILLVLHPNIGAQAKDFQCGEGVRVVDGASVDYEELMSASSLMVTDYSGIRFDFAYMRRPLVYYRPDTLPPQYEEGVASEAMRFGPECADHASAVEAICRMMRSGCELEEEYRQVIDRFFPYRDQNNCERLWKKAKELQEEFD